MSISGKPADLYARDIVEIRLDKCVYAFIDRRCEHAAFLMICVVSGKLSSSGSKKAVHNTPSLTGQSRYILFSVQNLFYTFDNAVGVKAVFGEKLLVGSGLRERVLNADKLGRNAAAFDASTSETAEPRPPWMLCSSAQTIAPVSLRTLR